MAKDKHDCFITNLESEILADVFTIPNTLEGFNSLLERIQSVTTPQDKIYLEAPAHQPLPEKSLPEENQDRPSN